jgi:two-component system LytT family response regulator
MDQTIIIPTAKYSEFICTEEIILCKAAGSYSEVVLSDKRTFTVSKNLHWWEQQLNPGLFFRVHKSFLINLKYVCRISRPENTVHLKNGDYTPVSRSLKKQLFERIKKLR